MQNIIMVKYVNRFECGVRSFEEEMLNGIAWQTAYGRWRITKRSEIGH